MIGRIHGTLVEVVEHLALVDVHGLGYEVELTSGALGSLNGVGSACEIYTHHAVREDAQTLYGFSSREERDVFRTLIKVSGVGPSSRWRCSPASASTIWLARCSAARPGR